MLGPGLAEAGRMPRNPGEKKRTHVLLARNLSFACRGGASPPLFELKKGVTLKSGEASDVLLMRAQTRGRTYPPGKTSNVLRSCRHDWCLDLAASCEQFQSNVVGQKPATRSPGRAVARVKPAEMLNMHLHKSGWPQFLPEVCKQVV